MGEAPKVKATPALSERLALRPKEAAVALGISERTLRQLAPTLPHLRLGGCLLFPVRVLERWLEEQAKAERAWVDREVEEILGAVGRQSNKG